MKMLTVLHGGRYIEGGSKHVCVEIKISVNLSEIAMC